MSTEPRVFDIPHVFMRIMEYLPKKTQKDVALVDKKRSKMAYAFNFWYFREYQEVQANNSPIHKTQANAKLWQMVDQNSRALPEKKDPQLAQKLSAVRNSVPKRRETAALQFCTPLGLSFLSKVESDVTTLDGRRTLRAIKAGHVGENLFRALSSFKEKVLAVIDEEIKKYEEMVKPDEDILALSAADQEGTLAEFVQENRERIFEAYKYELDEKGVDTTNLTDASDETLTQYALSLMHNYEAPKRSVQQEIEYQRLNAISVRLSGRDENKENQTQPQQQPEPLSLSPSLSPR